MIVIGNSGVGKSTLLRRLVEGNYSEDNISTIGAEFGQKVLTLRNNLRVHLQLWDTAGQDRLRIISRNYFRNPNAVLFCFDLTDLDSFLRIREWHASVREELDSRPHVLKMLVGTKADRSDKLVSEAEAGKLAVALGMAYESVSAKTGYNVNVLF